MIEKKPVYTPQSQCMELKKTRIDDDGEEESKVEDTKPKKVQSKKHLPGKECRKLLLKRPKQEMRCVPAFTYQALQKNTMVIPPRKFDIYRKNPVSETYFYVFLKRGDIPVASTGAVRKNKNSKEFPLRWFCKPEELDYCYYLPIFIDGLADSSVEVRTLAQYGAMDLVNRAPQKVLPALPKLILPLKRALNTRDKKIIICALKVIQHMVLTGPCIGQALVPYYRQLLATCNLYKNINVNLGEGIDANRDNRIGDVIEDTLHILENCGGPNAFINIKYMIPTYESTMHRPNPPALVTF